MRVKNQAQQGSARPRGTNDEYESDAFVHFGERQSLLQALPECDQRSHAVTLRHPP
jgi:hypothetical protein